MNLASIASKAIQSAQNVASTINEAKGVIEDALKDLRASEEKLRGKLAFIGDSRIDRIEDRVRTEMDKWLSANPGATADEVSAAVGKEGKRQTSLQRFDKMAFDNFFSNLMSKQKELLSDVWE